MSKTVSVVVVALLAGLVVVSGCKKPADERAIIGDNTRTPEQDGNLIDVVVRGDTVCLCYKPGATKPTYSPGVVIVGTKGGSYLKKVVSTSVRGDTLVVTTTQACLTDAFQRLKIDTTVALIPESTYVESLAFRESTKDAHGRSCEVHITSGPVHIIPLLGGRFEVKVANVRRELWESGVLSAFVQFDTVAYVEKVDFQLSIDIDTFTLSYFRAAATSTDSLRLRGASIGLEASISKEVERKLGGVIFGVILIPIPIPPFCIPVTLETNLYAGFTADLTVTSPCTAANDVFGNLSCEIGAEYTNGGWNPIWQLTTGGSASGCMGPATSVTADLQGYLKGTLETKIFAVAGPYFYVTPYQYDEIAYPPLNYDLGLGIAAGIGVKVEILSWKLVDYDHAFVDSRLSLCHPAIDQPPSTPSTPIGPDSGHVDSSYSFRSSAVDPDGDSVSIRFAWGGGDTSAWSGYVPSGSPVSMSNSWPTNGAYPVTAQSKDVKGALSGWSASHQIVISGGGGNNPPNTPSTPSGPDSGQVGVSYQFTDSTTDPDGDSVSLRFSWGDGDTSGWSNFVSSGTAVSMSHAWSTAGSYTVKAQAEDAHSATSGWSNGHQVNMTGGVGSYPDSVVATVPLEAGTYGVAALPNGSYVYVTNTAHNNVCTIRTSDKTVEDTIPVGSPQGGVAVLPNGDYVYVAGCPNDSSVSVIRTSDKTVVATIQVGRHPVDVAALPGGDYVYVTNMNDNSVSVIRTSDRTVETTVPVGRAPLGVAALPDGSRVYVANNDDRSVSVIRTSNRAVMATVAVSGYARDVAALPSGDFVYVTNQCAACDSVSVIRTSDNTVVASIPVPVGIEGVAVLPNGNFVYVAGRINENGFVPVIRTSDNTVVATIPVGSEAYGVAVLPNGRYVYVTNFRGHVSVLGFRSLGSRLLSRGFKGN